MNFLFIKESWKKCHGLHTTVFNIDKMVVCVTQNPKWIQICLAHMMLRMEAGWSSSRSCCIHDCAVKSSARLQFHSWRVKHFFDSNWSGFQSTSERCVYSHCQTLNPLYVLQHQYDSSQLCAHTCILHGPHSPELWLSEDQLSISASSCSPHLNFLFVVLARTP